MSNRWQHKIVEISVNISQMFKDSVTQRAQAELEKLGAQGWELVAVTHPGSLEPMRLFFKKPG